MDTPARGDLIIVADETGFAIADAVTRSRLYGSFASFEDAAARAVRHGIAIGVGVWRENTDHGGRQLPPVPIQQMQV